MGLVFVRLNKFHACRLLPTYYSKMVENMEANNGVSTPVPSEPISVTQSLDQLEEQINNTLKLSENMKNRKMQMKESLLETPTLKPSKALEEALNGHKQAETRAMPSQEEHAVDGQSTSNFAGISDEQREALKRQSKKEDPTALQRRASVAVAMSVAERESLVKGYQPSNLDKVEVKAETKIIPYEINTSSIEAKNDVTIARSARYPGFELLYGAPTKEDQEFLTNLAEKPTKQTGPKYAYPGYELLGGGPNTPQQPIQSRHSPRPPPAVLSHPTTTPVRNETSAPPTPKANLTPKATPSKNVESTSSMVADSLEIQAKQDEEKQAEPAAKSEVSEPTANGFTKADVDSMDALAKRRAEKDARDAAKRIPSAGSVRSEQEIPSSSSSSKEEEVSVPVEAQTEPDSPRTQQQKASDVMSRYTSPFTRTSSYNRTTPPYFNGPSAAYKRENYVYPPHMYNGQYVQHPYHHPYMYGGYPYGYYGQPQADLVSNAPSTPQYLRNTPPMSATRGAQPVPPIIATNPKKPQKISALDYSSNIQKPMRSRQHIRTGSSLSMK